MFVKEPEKEKRKKSTENKNKKNDWSQTRVFDF